MFLSFTYVPVSVVRQWSIYEILSETCPSKTISKPIAISKPLSWSLQLSIETRNVFQSTQSKVTTRPTTALLSLNKGEKPHTQLELKVASVVTLEKNKCWLGSEKSLNKVMWWWWGGGGTVPARNSDEAERRYSSILPVLVCLTH